MAEIKKISTELQPLDKLLDTSGDAGTSGQILTSTGTGTNWVPAGAPGTGIYLPLVGGTLSGPLTVGADADGHDVKFFGNATGEYMLWDESASKLRVYHTADNPAVDVFTVSAGQPTYPQMRVGRNAAEFWGVYTDDRNAHLVHRQDETSGTMTTRFDQWDSNTSDANGYWVWRSGDGSGGNMSTALELKQSGNAIFAGNVDVRGGGSGYNSIRIVNNTTADNNKQAGITSSNYVGNSVSIMQYATTSGANTVYYGSADGSHSGLSNHRFYVNADPNTPASGHTQALHIASDTNATFAGTISSGAINSSGGVRAEDMFTIYDGAKVLQLKNDDNDFSIRNGNSGLVPLTIESGGEATFADSLTTVGNILTLAKVGIGTASPQSFTKLDVRSGNVDGDHAIVAYAYNGVGGIAITGHGYATDNTHAGSSTGIRGISNGGRTVNGSINIGGQFTASGAANNYAIITTAGNVGINNTTPTFALDVIGTARVSGNTEFPTQSTSDDSTKVATTAFVKNILAEQPAGLTFLGNWNADTNSPTLVSGGGELADGAATSVAANKLNDTSATFQSDNITVNADRVRVVQANGNIAFSVITVVNSNTQLTLTDDIATTVGDTYIVEKSPFLSPEGGYYIVGTSGDENLNGITDWVAGDWVLIATTNVFQKIDNTSILSGAGAENKVTQWASSSGDPSVTLASGPITFSTNDSTFAGNITLPGDGKLLKFTPTSYDDVELGIDSNGFVIYNTTDTRYDLKINGDGNATFGGDVAITGNFTAGAASPNQMFEFDGNSGNPELTLKNNTATSSTDGTATLQFKQALNSAGGKIVSGRDSNYSGGATRDSHLKFYTATNASDTLALTLDSDNKATFAGAASFAGAIDVTGHIQAFTRVYLRESIQLLNKAADGWLFFATRNTSASEAVYDVSNVGTLSTAGDATFGGSVKVKNALIDNASVTSATATTVVAIVPHATYNAVFFDFVIKNGTNVRAGTVYACHNGASTPLVEFAETSTVDLGDTSDVTLSVAISGTNMFLQAVTTSSTWTIKSLIRAM